jgi:hypothetical protein
VPKKTKKGVPARALPATETSSRVPRKLRGVVPADEDPAVANRKPAWGLALLDRDDNAEWAAWPSERDGLLKILAFLQEMERLSWTEIRAQQTGGKQRRGAKHKSIPVENLIPEAQQRLLQLDLDDHDELFRFRLGNMERLWGVFVGGHHVFYPIWWDPDHRICPSAER